MSWRAGLRSGSSNFDTENRQAAIDLEESLRREQARKRAIRAALQRPPSTGTTPAPSRPGTPPLPHPVDIMPDPVVNFEDENGQDEERALMNAIEYLKDFNFDMSDLDFVFGRVEIKMKSVGVKKNYTKFEVLSSIIPRNVQKEYL